MVSAFPFLAEKSELRAQSVDSGSAPAATATTAPTSRPLSDNAAHAAAPTLSATPTTGPIALDGHLTESDWKLAIPATAFTQVEPLDGAAPSSTTEVRILFDDQALYVGARLSSPDGRISAPLGRRDAELPDSDWFIVVFDSYHDHTGGYRFKVNPAGVVGDEANGDRSWNPVWSVVTAVDSAGWTAEMRIPFSQLRFSPAESQVWGVQFYREIKATAEKDVFSYSPKRERGGPARFGHLLGLTDIKRGKTLELLPYFATRAEFKEVPLAPNATLANPFRSGSDYFRQMGADIKYRLTSNFTIDATLNPDFGQIEADEAQVNLSANENFLREQRPFFVEGSNIFRFGTGVAGGIPAGGGGGGGGGGNIGGFGGTQLLYSRRVGRAPQGSLPSQSQYAEVPDASTILGAAKVSGRTAKGWSIGVMEAVTGKAVASFVDATGQRFATDVEPATNYFVGRAKKDFREGQSNVGGIITSVHRDLGDSALSLRLRSSAIVAGADFGHLFNERQWELSGYTVGSYVAGSTAAIGAAQRSSARYFQRPDATYLGVDSSATTLAGWAASLNLSRPAGLHWTGNARLNATSPSYEVNDLGFQNFADRVSVNLGVNYDESMPGTWLRKWGASIRPDLRTNFGGDVLARSVRGDVDAQLLNYVGARLEVSHELESLDDRLTRGGPLTLTIPSSGLGLALSGDPRSSYPWLLTANERRDAAGGWGQARSVRLGFKPSDRWSGEIAPSFSRNRGTAQYVTRVFDTLAVNTYGRRYIFAPIAQTTLSTTLRINLTMSPRLTYAFVAEPFIASGQYGAPKELAAPRTFDFLTYGVDVGTATQTATGEYRVDPDGSGPAAAFTVPNYSFNVRSVNATGNLRWEWRPGSSLFLVWQHRRSNPATTGDFDFRRDVRDLFAQRSSNTLLFKVSYWVNP